MGSGAPGSAGADDDRGGGGGAEQGGGDVAVSRAPLVAIEILEPGEHLAAHVLSFAQLRRLHESLGRLIQTAVPS
jgi:hypothetical protein